MSPWMSFPEIDVPTPQNGAALPQRKVRRPHEQGGFGYGKDGLPLACPPSRDPHPGGVMKRLLVGIVGASALATTLLIVKQQRDPFDTRPPRLAPGEGEGLPPISLDRLREMGF